MSNKVIGVYKFVGSIGLGLLTGLSYTTLQHTAPALLTLPSASTSKSTLRALLPRLDFATLILSSICSTTLLSAYVWSPPRSRHPYLLYASLAAVLPYLGGCYRWICGRETMKEWEIFVMKGGNGGSVGKAKGVGKGVATPPSSASSDEEWEVEASGMKTKKTAEGVVGQAEGEVNGEAVKEAVRSWRRDTMVKFGSYGVGFVMMVVGIWGDGANTPSA